MQLPPLRPNCPHVSLTLLLLSRNRTTGFLCSLAFVVLLPPACILWAWLFLGSYNHSKLKERPGVAAWLFCWPFCHVMPGQKPKCVVARGREGVMWGCVHLTLRHVCVWALHVCTSPLCLRGEQTVKFL